MSKHAFSFRASLARALSSRKASLFRARPGTTALACAIALAAGSALPSVSSAFSATADISGGYGTQVLSQILRVWQQPEGARGMALVELKIAPSGSLAGCSVIQPSATPAADASLCAAAHNAAPYPYPPFGAESLVSLAMAYGPGNAGTGNAPAPVQSYAEMLRQAIAPHVIMPNGLSGSWTTVVELDIWADGTMRDCRISHPSGNAEVDAAVMAAVRTPGVIPLPPEHMEQRVSLSFTLSAR
ncbi:cell envelope integrity protein TolA [uncultured Mailhella sp.]|uniref:cell envelope integrity protein TolA n=1 Tax=uncultured Mailhella sp. TaxID=1981031 RepID=UPI0025D0048D|nr:cell envelope integrity protein TolA [uncultured Mailhella sp.]